MMHQSTEMHTRKGVRHLSHRPPGGKQHWQATPGCRTAVHRTWNAAPGHPVARRPPSELRPDGTGRQGTHSATQLTRDAAGHQRLSAVLVSLHRTSGVAIGTRRVRLGILLPAGRSVCSYPAGRHCAQGIRSTRFFSAAGQLRLSSVVIISPGWLPSTARPPQRQTEAPGTTGA